MTRSVDEASKIRQLNAARRVLSVVRAKTGEEQAMQLLHRTRAGFVSLRTETANQIRAALYEFRKVLPVGLTSPVGWAVFCPRVEIGYRVGTKNVPTLPG